MKARAISPDDKRLAVAHRRWTLAIRDVTDCTNTVIFEVLDSPIRLPTFSPDGSRFAAVVADGVIHVWDTITCNLLRKSKKHCAEIESLVLSADGTRIIPKFLVSQTTSNQMWLVEEDLVVTIGNHMIESAEFSGNCLCKYVAFCIDNTVHVVNATTGDKLHKLHILSDYRSRLSVSLDSTRLLISSAYVPAQVLDLRSLPTSVGTEFTSCVYPPGCMMIQSQKNDGWYYGTNGARLIWLPHNMHPVWLATGKQFGSRRLILGSGNDVAVLDVDDYLEALPAGIAWREAGVRYLENPWPFDALMSESRSKV